jgi:hypothetical protein
MRLSAEAWRCRAAAAASLAGLLWDEALHHAREANRLQRTQAGDDLLLIARLLAG